MSERVFIDTNVLVYADDLDAGVKREQARELLRGALASGIGVVSTQVLQEFFVITTRKLGVDARYARRKVEILSSMTVVRIEVPLILSAIDLHRLHAISFWDALIVKCAAQSGCGKLLTEDLQHGQLIEGVQVFDPFLS